MSEPNIKEVTLGTSAWGSHQNHSLHRPDPNRSLSRIHLPRLDRSNFALRSPMLLHQSCNLSKGPLRWRWRNARLPLSMFPRNLSHSQRWHHFHCGSRCGPRRPSIAPHRIAYRSPKEQATGCLIQRPGARVLFSNLRLARHNRFLFLQ